MATSISRDQIAEVQQATDIVELISAYVPLKRKGKDYLALCPFHQEKTPSFSVSAAKQIFKCFGCGAAGDAIGFLMKHERMEFVEAVQLLAERAGIALRHEVREAESGESKRLMYDACRWARDEYRRQLVAAPAGKRALDYLIKRGLTRETVDRFHLGFAPDKWDHLVGLAAARRMPAGRLEQVGLASARQGGGWYDRFRNRVVFPIADSQGRPIAFGARALGEETPKYLNSPETSLFNKGRALYGLDVAKEAIVRERRVCVVEGYMDLVMAHQHGIDWVVATLGTALTEAHLHLLRRYADEAVLVFDGDAAGRAATDRGMALFLAQELEVRVCALPEGEDPCDFLLARGAPAFLAAVSGGRSAFEFKLEEIETRHDVRDEVDARRAIDEALELLANLPARTRSVWAIRRDRMLAALASRVGVSERSLRDRLTHLGSRPRGTPSAAAPPSPRVQLERELVELMVCRPDLAEAARTLLPPERMQDSDLARLAGRVLEAASGGRRPDLKEVLALLAGDGLAGLAADLAAAGEAKGRFEERLAAIEGRLASQAARRSAVRLRGQLAGAQSESERAALLRQLDEVWRGSAGRTAPPPAGRAGSPR